jgi:BirA family biotin operon repressor/biotin-[acetyl-CoA-carboxylase] ligase
MALTHARPCSFHHSHAFPMEHASPQRIPLTDALPSLLRTRRFGHTVRGYAAVPSTNTLAAEWAAEGAPEGSMVVAEYQAAGRGRQGRSWHAKAGQNLTFSIVLRPALPPQQLGLITLAASVAVAEAIAPFTRPLEPAIKWPNDILLEDRKCCGMLLESAMTGREAEAPSYVILGIGLNVNQDAFPGDLAPLATSLLLATGRFVPRERLLAELLARLEMRYESLAHDGGAAIRTAYEARLAALHRPTTLRLAGSGEAVHGVVEGVTPTGALRVRTETGEVALHAAEVTMHPPHA